MSTTIRIGFLGIDGSAIALAAEPTTSASAVIFSAIDQLRKFFDAHPSRSSPAWGALFDEIAEANVRDAQEHHNHTTTSGGSSSSSNQKRKRTQAKKVLARKISLFSTTNQKHIPGYEVTSKTVQEVFLAGSENNNNNSSSSSSSSSSFFWMDLTDPPCKVQITFDPPVKHNNQLYRNMPSYAEEIDQTPTVITWTVEKVIQRVIEKVGSSSALHPHNLVCHLEYPRQESSSSSSTVLPRNRQLIDLFYGSRLVHLDVRVAKPPSCTVRVVDAAVAEKATRLLYAKMGYSEAPNENQQHFSENNDGHQNTESYSFLRPDEVDDPYALDASQLVDSCSRRTISLCNHSSIQWSSTLAEIHREATRLIYPLKGRGFLCLNSGLIQRSAHAAARGDHQNANLRLASTGNINGSQVPVFEPTLTLRQIARMTVDAPGGSNSSSPGEIQLYIVVNPKRNDDHQPPKVVSTRKVYSNDILYEADDVRFQILDVLYPNTREARILQLQKQQQQQQQHNSSSFIHSSNSINSSNPHGLKRSNVIPGSPDDSHYHTIQLQRAINDDRRAKSKGNVTFAVDDNINTQNPFVESIYESPLRPSSASASYYDHQQNDDVTSAMSPPPDFFFGEEADQSNNNFSTAFKPTSPRHREGTEAFISMPSSSSSSSGTSEVFRLLLPDGYFPLRRLKRFLKMQAVENGLVLTGQQQDFRIQFGTKVLEDDDVDVKNYVNPETNIVFLNAF